MSKLAIANKVMTITNDTGYEDTRNLAYGKYVYDPVFGYIEVKTITGDTVQLRREQITEFNGVAGTPTYASILTALLANIKS